MKYSLKGKAQIYVLDSKTSEDQDKGNAFVLG